MTSSWSKEHFKSDKILKILKIFGKFFKNFWKNLSNFGKTLENFGKIWEKISKKLAIFKMLCTPFFQ